MRPSNYHYIKRMWTRNFYKKQKSNIPIFLQIPFTIMFIGFFVIFYAAWFIFECIIIVFNYIFSFFKKIFSKTNNIDNKKDLNEELSIIKNLSIKINSTCDFEEFIYLFKEITNKLKNLSLYENEKYFYNSTPSNDLDRIMKNKAITEKEFINRHVKKYGVQSLQYQKHHLYFFDLESISYFNSILDDNNIF